MHAVNTLRVDPVTFLRLWRRASSSAVSREKGSLKVYVTPRIASIGMPIGGLAPVMPSFVSFVAFDDLVVHFNYCD